MPPFQRRTLVLIGAQGVGRRTLKQRLMKADSARFGEVTPREYISLSVCPPRWLDVIAFSANLSYTDTLQLPGCGGGSTRCGEGQWRGLVAHTCLFACACFLGDLRVTSRISAYHRHTHRASGRELTWIMVSTRNLIPCLISSI